MAALDELLEAVDLKLKTCSFIQDTTNVLFGEEPILSGLGDEKLPRLETVITKLKCDGYVDQRNLKWTLRLGTAVYFRTDNENYTASLVEMKTAVIYGKEIADKYFSFLDERQAGNPPCNGFEQIGDYPEIFFEKELIPHTMAAIVHIEIELLLPDTETL
ncbi:MAG: hypothetical protein WC346_07745 [Methanogenium sp.]|jgi:hypothetical protein